MNVKHVARFALFTLLLSWMIASPVKSVQAASLNSVNFYWSGNHGGSIVVQRCGNAAHQWLTSEEMYPDRRRLGSWYIGSLNGCQDHYIATGVQSEDVIQVGVGLSDQNPQGDLFRAVGTTFYNVYRVNGTTQLEWHFDHDLLPENPNCPNGRCTGANPMGTTCANDAQTIDVYPIEYGSHALGYVELRWSAVCQALWTRTVSYYVAYVTAKVHPADDPRGGAGYDTAHDSNYRYQAVSLMAYQPNQRGMACGHIQVSGSYMSGSACTRDNRGY